MGGKAGSGQVTSLSSRTGSPSSMARLTAASAPSTGQPRVSSPGSPAASVAVLSTGSAPSTSATRAASTFAPGRPSTPGPWPPRSAIACRDASSTQTTAGSVRLPASSGAISRTVAPVARKQTSASHSAQACGSASAAGPG